MKYSLGLAIKRSISHLRSLLLNRPTKHWPLVQPGFTEQQLSAAYLTQTTGLPDGFVTDVSVEDEMYIYLRNNLKKPEFALYEYMFGGNEAIQVIENILKSTGKSITSLQSFLDFACGYGKSTRFLAQKLNPSKIWVSDIYSDAVDFQRSTLKVNGFYSAISPDDVRFPRLFEVIYVGSLFSHLPKEQFKAWLLKLYRQLTRNGILIFSTQGPSVHQLTGDAKIEGFQFSAESESRSLDKSQYGSTTVTEEWVCRTAAELGIVNIKYLERELWAQDIFIVSRESDLSGIETNAFPRGTVENASVDATGNLHISGWALDRRAGAPISKIEVLIDGKAVGEAKLGLSRTDVAEYFGRKDSILSGWNVVIDNDNEAKINSVVTLLLHGRTGNITCLASTISRQFNN